MQAIVLAGGLGTRLKSVVGNIPKPMADIQGKPFLAYLLEYLARQGFTDIILATFFKHEIIQQYFGSCYKQLKLTYIIDKELLGTGGAIINAFQQAPIQDHVFVLNGDTFIELDFNRMYDEHLSEHRDLTVALRHVHDTSRYGAIKLANNRIIEFAEKTQRQSGLINAGVYLFRRDLFADFSLPRKFSFENDFLVRYTPVLKPYGFMSDNYFIDIGIPEDYARAQNEIPMRFI